LHDTCELLLYTHRPEVQSSQLAAIKEHIIIFDTNQTIKVANKNYILDQTVAEKKMRRMALEIIENNADEKELILAGIRESGSIVARCIQKMLAEISSVKTVLLTITLDKRQPGEVTLSQSADFNDKVIILVDDVANSGKTLLYALKPFLAYHPKKIQTLVLVERSHNSFPVHPDYSGLSIATTLQEHIYVQVDEEKVLGAYLE
jgi:pyrimidine operon attenuation protein / uracil phosphoribosyltransferase